MSGWLTRLIESIFPYIPKCAGCGVEKGAQGSICPKCETELSALAAGHAEMMGLSAYSLYWYDGIAARIVRGYKYGDKRWLNIFMGDSMAEAAKTLGGFDAVCNVPLHEKRRKSRGFDQAELLAKRIAEQIKVPYIAGTKRTRNTKTQTKLNKAQRKDNMEGAFAPSALLSGRVLLIDDVLTTGATAAACAQALFQAGTREAFLLTFARAREAGGRFTDRK